MWAWLLGEWRTVGFVAASSVAIYLSTLVVTIRRLVERPPEAERRAPGLYCFHEQRQRDIGDRLGCSRMQVSRLLARAPAHLRVMPLLP